MPISIQFDEEELSREYTEFAVGGPTFETAILGNRYGIQQRAVRRTEAIRTWEIQFQGMSPTQRDALEAFFISKYGGGIGFRFYPPSDRAFSGFEWIGVGNGIQKTFPFYKQYNTPHRVINRRIVKPIASSMTTMVTSPDEYGEFTILFNGVSQGMEAGPDYSIDFNNGTITFLVAPANGLEIRLFGGEFNVPVVFDMDEFKVTDYGVFSEWDSIRLIELLPAALGIS